MNAFSKKVFEYRRSHKLTQQDLAEKIGVKIFVISGIEVGKMNGKNGSEGVQKVRNYFAFLDSKNIVDNPAHHQVKTRKTGFKRRHTVEEMYPVQDPTIAKQISKISAKLDYLQLSLGITIIELGVVFALVLALGIR